MENTFLEKFKIYTNLVQLKKLKVLGSSKIKQHKILVITWNTSGEIAIPMS